MNTEDLLDFDDPRWPTFKAGYRVPIDLRPLLAQLADGKDPAGTWQELWQELYHQGHVGEGSFVAVPHLVSIHGARAVSEAVDENTYALVSTIELARGRDGNPDVPAWARAGYESALAALGQLGLEELPRAARPAGVRAILGLLALVFGARTYGRFLAEFSEDELLELEKQVFDPGRPPEG